MCVFRPGSDVALGSGAFCGTSLKMAGRIKSSSGPVSGGWSRLGKKSPNGTRKRSSALLELRVNSLREFARTLANNRPGTVIWCMGGTQHTNGKQQHTRLPAFLQLALGNMGTAGGGTNIFRGHCNVQGATDLGVLANTLPGYYGLKPGSWAHWARVWEEDLDWLKGQFSPEKGR